jgi:hypothetical protein
MSNPSQLAVDTCGIQGAKIKGKINKKKRRKVGHNSQDKKERIQRDKVKWSSLPS